MQGKPGKSVEEIVKGDGRYCLEAVRFVRDGLGFTVHKHYSSELPDRPTHVSGEQLCYGLRELALKRWGMMARSVLAHWGIKTTRDFGEIVFLLVANGWMQKEPDDRIEDFNEVYDFSEL